MRALPHCNVPRRRPLRCSTRKLGLLKLCAAEQCSLDRIQHHVEIFAYILGEETQHEIAILLEQLVLATISAIGIGAFQVLRTIQLDGDACIGAQQVDFQSTPIVE